MPVHTITESTLKYRNNNLYVWNSKTYFFIVQVHVFKFLLFCFEFFNSSYHVEWNNATSTNRPPPRIFHFTLYTDLSFFDQSEISDVGSGRETKFRINEDQLSFFEISKFMSCWFYFLARNYDRDQQASLVCDKSPTSATVDSHTINIP